MCKVSIRRLHLVCNMKINNYLTNATPLGIPVILSFKTVRCTISPYCLNRLSISSSVTSLGKLVIYKLASFMSAPGGREYETFKRLPLKTI